jgi:long-chain acyl-CoA synthetase
MLLYLPLAHNFGRLMHLSAATRLHDRLPARPAAIAEALPAVRPTVLPSVPRVFEKVHAPSSPSSTSQTAPAAIGTGRSRRPGRQRAPGAGADPARLALKPAGRPARLLEGEGTARRPLRSDLGGAPLAQEIASSSTHSTS